MKIAHFADAHIRALRYMDEMNFTLEEMCKVLIQEKPDVIVGVGDLFHSKLTVSNEYFLFGLKFLKNLSDIAPLILVPGNHDLALANCERVDAITPLVDALKNSSKHEIIYLKGTESYSFYVDGGDTLVKFTNFSIIDNKEKWPTFENILNKNSSELEKYFSNEKINIVLYHGSINGCTVDNGWISRGNKDSLDIFKGYDYVLLGDIHLSQYLTPRIAYPGSLRQNNYGETRDKGFIIWDIENKEVFSSKRVILPQKRYFYTIVLDSNNVPKDLDIKQDSRIRVQLTKPLTLLEEFQVKESIKDLYTPCNEIPIIPPPEDSKPLMVQVGNTTILNDNIRKVEIQKELIKEFAKENNISTEMCDKILSLDEKYHSFVESDLLRNIIWSPKFLEWDNLFAYGEKNVIDFSKLNGLIGIFGENGSGKSSIVDVLCYVLHNSINKVGATKNVDYVNKLKETAKAKLIVECDAATYNIKRETHKTKTKQGEEKATNFVDFHRNTTCLNGETLPDTNKHIRDIFGSIEDFSVTSIIPQFGLTSFIDMGGTERKKLFAKFFDLEIFDIKFKNANEDAKNLKDKLNILQSSTSTEAVEKVKINIIDLKQSISEKEEQKTNKLLLIKEIRQKLETLVLVPIPSILDESEIKNLEKLELELEQLYKKQMFLKEQVKKCESLIRNSLIDNPEQKIEILKKDLAQIKHLEKGSELLKTIPNVPECKVCPLALNAYESYDYLLEVLKSGTREQKESLLFECQTLVNNKKKIAQINQELFSLSLQIEVMNSKKREIFDHMSKYQDAIIQNEKTSKIKNPLNLEILALEDSIRILNNSLMNLSKDLGKNEQELHEMNSKILLLEELQSELEIYNTYLLMMGKNGIAYWILSKRLPEVVQQTNHILSQVVNFRIDIENNTEEKSIKIFFVDKKGKRPIEIVSGAEKTISAIALRVALWKVSSLPKAPILILDEPFAYLDEKKFDSVIHFLSFLKTYFTHIFIITHDEDLKKIVDNYIYVNVDSNGISRCEV